MKVKYMNSDSVAMCRRNAKEIYNHVICSKKKRLQELFDDEKIIKSMSLEIKDFKLKCSGDNKLQEDVYNVKAVYESMQGLTDSQASEEKLWAAYTLSEQLDYMKKRWPATNEQFINNKYLFGHGPHRSLFRNGMSRLWWIGRVTKDNSYGDPYELTQFVCTHTDVIQFICEQPVCQQYNVMHGVLKALYDLDKAYKAEEENGIPAEQRKGVKVGKIIIQKTGKYMNLLSGTYLLDLYTEEKIYNMAKSYIIKLNKKLQKMK